MTYEVREFARVTKIVVTISVAAWIFLSGPGGTTLVPHHHAGHTPSMLQTMPSHLLLSAIPSISIMMGWAVMLIAMMSPVLINPICHIRLRSFTNRRTRSVTLFIAAYAMLWMVLGFVLLTITLATKLFTPQSSLPAAVVLLVALLWQFSPVKQCCLNGCHRHSEFAAFGTAADLDALRFGITHGVWCIGSCWALMWLPMLLSKGHAVAMVSVTVLIFSERLEHPRWPSWHWRGLNKPIRMVATQTRMYLDVT